MKWLRRLLYRRIVRGFEHRMKSLEDLMDSYQKQKQALYAKIEALGEPDHNNEQSRKIYQDELGTWDAYNRHEEVESGLMWVLKDFDRR